MTLIELKKHTTLYKVAKLLNISVPAVYHWQLAEQIPPKRLEQLKKLRPEWFNEEVKHGE